MFKVQFPAAKLKARLKAIGGDIATEKQNLTNAIGVQLLSLSQIAYREKSRGGMGSDGIKWDPLKPSTIAKKNKRGKANAKRKTTKSGKARPAGGSVAIGIDTGLQIASASPGATGNILNATPVSVTVGYGRSYSKYFAEKRPLMPNKLPPRWRELCNGVVNRWLGQILDRRISD